MFFLFVCVEITHNAKLFVKARVTVNRKKKLVLLLYTLIIIKHSVSWWSLRESVSLNTQMYHIIILQFENILKIKLKYKV